MGIVREENSAMTPFTPPEIGKLHAVLLGIHAGSANTKILACVWVLIRG